MTSNEVDAGEDNGGMNEGNGSDGRERRRSKTEYPNKSLSDSVDFAQAIARGGQREVPEARVMKELKLTSRISRAWTYRYSSARMFGLITKSGRGEEDTRYSLTDLGRRILNPRNVGEREAGLLEALLTPPIYATLLKMYEGGVVPIPEYVKNTMVEEGVLETVADEAAQAFLESVSYAGADTGGFVRTDGVPQKGRSDHPAGAHGKSGTPAPDPGMVPLMVPSTYIVHPVAINKATILHIPLPASMRTKDLERLLEVLRVVVIPDDDADSSIGGGTVQDRAPPDDPDGGKVA